MAIAFDVGTTATLSGGTPTSSVTFSHTCTGSNITLVVAAATNQSANVTGITYNGVAMTLAESYTAGAGGQQKTWMYVLGAAATGAHNVVVTFSTTTGYYDISATSYTGTNTGSPVGASESTHAPVGTTDFTNTITTLNANSWIIDAIADGDRALTPQDSQTFRTGTGSAISLDVYTLLRPTAGVIVTNYTASSSPYTLSTIELRELASATATGNMFLLF